MKILVTGGRDFDDLDYVWNVLDSIEQEVWSAAEKITHLIHGGCSGVDSMAAAWADDSQIQKVECPANWEKQGRSAGPVRNAAMLGLLNRDMDALVAFPGGRGTASMVGLARTAGVIVINAVDRVAYGGH